MFSLICKEEQKHGGIEAGPELRDGSAEQSWLPDQIQGQYSSILAHASMFPSSGRGERGNESHPYMKAGCSPSEHSIHPRAWQFPSAPHSRCIF